MSTFQLIPAVLGILSLLQRESRDESPTTVESLTPDQAVYLAEQLEINPLIAVIEQFRRGGGSNIQLNRVFSNIRRNPPQMSANKSQTSAASQSIEVERLQEEIRRLQNMREVTDRHHQDAGVQFNYLVPMSARLRGVHVVGEKLFEISREFPQLLDWEEYGLRIQVPEGATSEPCDIAIKAIVAGQFEFPECTDLVSAVYAISVSKRLTKPVMLEIQHCVAITREEQGRFLSFVRAQCNQPQLPYQFEPLDNGTFPPHSDYGKIACDRFSLVAIRRIRLRSKTASTSLKEVKIPAINELSLHGKEAASVNESASPTDSQATPLEEGISSPLLETTSNNELTAIVTQRDDVPASPSSSAKANELLPIGIETTCDDDNQFQRSPTLSASVEAAQSTETSDEDAPMKYSLYVFFINKARNSWVWHFNVTKDLNALVKYVQQSHPNWQNGIHLPFEYSESKLWLQFDEDHSYQRWWIKPSIRPCTFLKHVVDEWNHSIPYCRKVKVYAQEGPDTAPFIDYPVHIKGTTEEGMSIIIQEQLQTTDPVLQPAAQAPPDHDRSTAHLSLQRSPEISDLLNRVAAKAPIKWKNLGRQLKIEHQKLKTIQTENADSLDCFAEVFDLWERGGSPPYTWATIIDALRAEIVGEVQLAYELEQWVMST